jgi:hypothetical protein
MSTLAQVAANQVNSQLSTGPKSPEGKAVSSKNGFSHGLTARFVVQDWEDMDKFRELRDRLWAELRPETTVEQELVHAMIEHRWLVMRAVNLQDYCFNMKTPLCTEEKLLALYLRYQTTPERAFYKAMHELQKLREQSDKTQIGFASQYRQREIHELKKKHLERSIWLAEHRTLGRQLANEHAETLTLQRFPEKTTALEASQAARGASKAA